MIYNTEEARQTAREGISYIYQKLATTRPCGDWGLQDIEKAMYYLQVLDTAIGHETWEENRKAWAADRKTRRGTR